MCLTSLKIGRFSRFFLILLASAPVALAQESAGYPGVVPTPTAPSSVNLELHSEPTVSPPNENGSSPTLVPAIEPLLLTIAPEEPTATSVPTALPEHRPAPLEEGRVLLDEIPSDREALAYQAFFRDATIQLPSQVREYFDERSVRMAWEGNTPTLVTEIPKVVVRFRLPPAPPGTTVDPNVPDWFDIHLEFLAREILVRTTHPRNRANLKGMRLPIGPNDAWRVYLEGQANSGVAVLIPKTKVAGQYARSVLLCPRFAFRYKRGKVWEVALVQSDYRLGRALFVGEGRVSGSALTAGQIGLARAEILTTPTMYRSRGVVDEAYAIDPRAQLTYVPITTEHLPDVDGSGSVTAGMQVKLELQRQAGFKRTSIARDVVWIKPVEITDNEPWFIKVSHTTTARVAPGICYSVFAERGVDHHFTKEQFELPERLRH